MRRYKGQMTLLDNTALEALSDTEKNLYRYFRPTLAAINNFVKDTQKITEIMYNADETVWIDNAGKLKQLPITCETKDKESITRALAGIAGKYIGSINNKFELATNLETKFLTGRFHALLPPVTNGIAISIRIPPRKIMTLDELVERQTLTKKHAAMLANAVAERKNIIISGATGSGKTTILNALLNTFTNQMQRIVTIEDTLEIQSQHKNTVSFLIGKNFSYGDAIRASLRMRPDRIFIGEIRDGETALELAKAWRTGHPGGIATIHAENTHYALDRIIDLFGEVVVNPSERLARNAIDIIIQVKKQIVRGTQVRKLTEITHVEKITNEGGN